MGFLEMISQMFSNKEKQKPTDTGGAGISAKRDLSLRNEYLQYQMQEQENGRTPLRYEDWIAAKQAAMKNPPRQ